MYWYWLLLPVLVGANLPCDAASNKQHCLVNCCGWCTESQRCYRYNDTACPDELEVNPLEYHYCTYDRQIIGRVIIILVSSVVCLGLVGSLLQRWYEYGIQRQELFAERHQV